MQKLSSPLDCSKTFKIWQHLWSGIVADHSDQPVDSLQPKWSSDGVQRFTAAGRRFLDARREYVAALVQECRERLAPFGEPLELDLGMNRWLSREREEAWSDWFSWFFNQLTVRDVAFLFNIDDWIVEPDHDNRVEEVKREIFVKFGHDDATGRLDIGIFLPGSKAIVVEIKLGSANNAADIGKHEGYMKAIKEWNRECRCFLMVTDAPFPKDPHGFKVLRYDDFCLRLRRWIVQAEKRRRGLAFFALALAVVGAIESCRLGFSVAGDLASDRTIKHLNSFLETYRE